MHILAHAGKFCMLFSPLAVVFFFKINFFLRNYLSIKVTVSNGSRTKHPGTKHPMPLFATPDKTSHKDLSPRTKHPMLFLSPRT